MVGRVWICVISLMLMYHAVSGFKLSYDYDYCAAPLQLEQTKTNLNLMLVQVITRHGDRTTLSMLPNDNRPFLCNITTFVSPSLNNDPLSNPQLLFRKNYLSGVIPGNCNLGQLTEKGYNQHLTLGTNYRNLYVDTYGFLKEEMDATEVLLRSTDIPRTLQSAQANFWGLYPPDPPKQGYVPVLNIFTMDAESEYVFPNDLLCPRAPLLYQQIMKSPEIIEYEKSKQPLLAQIALALGVNVTQLPIWTRMFDAFHVMKCYGMGYPNGITQKMVDEVWEVANWEYNFQLNNTELVRLWIGYFAKELLENIQAKVALNSNFTPKYLMYSGHDTTLGALLSAFGVYDGHWPPYASHIELELWSDSISSYQFVQVKYQGTGLRVPGCSAVLCPIKEFYQAVTPFIPDNYEEECSNKN